MPDERTTETATKRDLVLNVAAKVGVPQNDVADIIQSALTTISEALAEGERLEIRNFGVFEIKSRNARIGRNARTGEEVPIQQKRIASFRPGKALKEWVATGQRPSMDSSDPSEPAQPTPPAQEAAPSTDGGGEQQSLF